jgi:hypothetical protein
MLLVKEKVPVLVAELPVGLGGAEPYLESSEPHLDSFLKIFLK